MVAEFARILAVYLKRAGLKLDIDLIVAGGYLQNLVWGRPDHAGVASAMLKQMGYGRVSQVVASQMDRRLPEGETDEADLVFLAEHFIGGETFSFHMVREEAELPELSRETTSRAESTRERVETILGISLSEIMLKHARGIRAASTQGIRDVYLLMHGSIEILFDSHLSDAMEMPLGNAGIRQAKTLSEKLREVPLSAVYCSHMRPCFESARIIAEPHGLEPTVKSGLSEIDPGNGGLTLSEIRQLYFRQPGLDTVNFRHPGGETIFECTARVIPAFYDILNSTHGNMAIVGHDVVNRIILCQVLGLSLERLFELDQDYCAINQIRCDESHFRLHSLNGVDLPH
jgi:probable phosphoglycerate mutase